MPRPKGLPKTGGRVKGSADTVKTLRDMVLQALDNVGGVAYLEAQAAQNPAPFMSLLGRVLPLTLAGDKNNPIQTRVIHEDWRGVVVAAIDAQRQLPEANTAEIIDVQADSVKADKLT